MANVIHIERDQEGLFEALGALFEESYQTQAIGGSSAFADGETMRRLQSSVEPLVLSPGYFTRANYLLDLGHSIETGVQYSATMLTRDDVMGLRTLSRAKAEFERKHPSCGSCGTRQDNCFAPRCRNAACGVKFSRGNA